MKITSKEEIFIFLHKSFFHPHQSFILLSMLVVAQIKYWANPLETKQEYLDISVISVSVPRKQTQVLTNYFI